MREHYDSSMAEFSRVSMWEHYEGFPQHRNDELPEIENSDTRHVIHAIMACGDAIRATIIEQARLTRELLKQRKG